MRVLVSGVNGFVGAHMVRELAEHSHVVCGVTRSEPAAELGAQLAGVFRHDLTEVWPDVDGFDAVIHLAGLSAVGPSFDAPQRYIETNSRMVTNLGEALLRASSSAHVLIVSSGAVYAPGGGSPLDETARVACSSPYVVSKLLVEGIAAYYRGRGLPWTVARPFNHIGPGQGPGFLLPDLYQAVLSAAEGDRTIRVGDLTRSRDYTDVRDVVAAYRQLIEATGLLHPVYNVCSGRPRSGHDLLAEVIGGRPLTVETDPSRLRPNDAPVIRGSAGLLAAETGWVPRIPIEDSVAAYLRWRDLRGDTNRTPAQPGG